MSNILNYNIIRLNNYFYDTLLTACYSPYHLTDRKNNIYVNLSIESSVITFFKTDVIHSLRSGNSECGIRYETSNY